jgi:hypothetical protein
MRCFATTGLVLCLLLSLVGAASMAREEKKTTLEDDLKAFQGKWRAGKTILTFMDSKTLHIVFGGDASGSVEFELKEKEKKRYIVYQITPKVEPTWMSYQLEGKRLVLTVEQGTKFAGGTKLELMRVEKK